MYPEGHTDLLAITFLGSIPLTQVIVINFGFEDFVGVGDLKGVGVAEDVRLGETVGNGATDTAGIGFGEGVGGRTHT